MINFAVPWEIPSHLTCDKLQGELQSLYGYSNKAKNLYTCTWHETTNIRCICSHFIEYTVKGLVVVVFVVVVFAAAAAFAVLVIFVVKISIHSEKKLSHVTIF